MSSASVHSKKPLKGMDSRKSQSWWWESHIGPRNSKWLVESLEEMDQNCGRMRNLIDSDGDSFAKKAEMYYQRRPELVAHVEEFNRMYKSLAERYEHLTGELRKNLLPDLQSQGFLGSDTGPEPTSLSPSLDPRMSVRRPGHRAAGFDFFLGSGRSGFDRGTKGDETSSLSDSETESDVSSLHSYPGMSGNLGEEGAHLRTMDSEIDPYDEAKQTQQHENNNESLRRTGSENFDDLQAKIVDYEAELKMAKEKIRLSEEEVTNLKIELQNLTSAESTISLHYDIPTMGNSSELQKDELEFDGKKVPDLQGSGNAMELVVSDPDQKMRVLVEELRITKERVQVFSKEVIQLRKDNIDLSEKVRKMQDLLKMSQKDASAWKAKLEAEKRQSSKLQDRIARYKASLTDRENEVRELKEVLSDAGRKYQLHAEISRLSDEKTRLEEKLREWEVHSRSLETQHGIVERKLNEEVEHLTADIAKKIDRLEALKVDFDAYKVRYNDLVSEKDKLSVKIDARNVQIAQMEKQLQQVIAEKEGKSKLVEELGSKVEELKIEVERQKVLTLEAAEGKREAIRQLCFSLEHYRNGYKQLRQTFMGHKQLHVLAS